MSLSASIKNTVFLVTKAWWFIAFFLLLHAQQADAKKLYKYTNDKGVVNFTDKQPDHDIFAEESYLAIDPKNRIQLRQIGSSKNPTYQIVNEYYAPVEILLTANKVRNITSTPPFPIHTIVKPNSTKTIGKIHLRNPSMLGSYNLSFIAIPGMPQPNFKSNALYQMPFQSGKNYLVSQGFGGEYSHFDSTNYYAIDIAMPIGSNIYAARKGIVMAVESNFFDSGTKSKYLTRANHVTVLHDDSTFAIYAHLDLASVRVHPGERVTKGTYLGKSGNTGFSTGPHLHFAVLHNAGLHLNSIPFKFIGNNKTSIVPIENEYLFAP